MLAVNKENKDRSRRLLKINGVLSDKRILAVICLAVSLIMFCSMNLIINLVMEIPGMMENLKDGSFETGMTGSSSDSIALMEYLFKINNYPLPLFFIMWLIILIADFRIVCAIRTSYADYNIGQKGSEKWTGREEIRSEYKSIPEKTYEYPGRGGVPVARDKNSIYIDDGPVNNLIIGITRSGKGEMFVFPMIDIYSRAKEKASMIITDPKLELAGASIDTLEKRGYECHILNLIDPEYSSGFNPLTLIINEYKEGNYSQAELLCSGFCYSIFNPDEGDGDSQFWSNNSTNLLSALIIAHIEDCLKADEELNIRLKTEHDEKEGLRLKKMEAEALDNLSEEERSEYELIKCIREASLFMDEDEIAFKYALDKEQVHLYLNSELPAIESGYVYREFVPVNENEKKINMYSIITTFSALANAKADGDTTQLDEYFFKRPALDRARLKYAGIGMAGEKTKGSIYSNTLSKLTVFTYEEIARMTAESTLNLLDLGFGSKPVAVFIGIPDYDSSNHFIASVFIRQVYFLLSKTATGSPGGKCYREVIFLLDEFGNLPPIDNMVKMITVCLSRNIKFNMIIQSYAQVEKLYGKDSETIIGNAGNQIYIQTNDSQTAKHFSELLGNETVVNISRSGRRFSFNKSLTESYESRPLFNENELMRMKPGECIIKRVSKREDNKRNPVEPSPIKNTGENRMKYRYMYLADDFNTDIVLYESPKMREIYSRINEIRKAEGKNRLTAPEFSKAEIESTAHIDLSRRVFDIESYLKSQEYEMLYADRVFDEKEIRKICNLMKLVNSDTEDMLNGKYRIKDIRVTAEKLLDENRIGKNEFEEITDLISYNRRKSRK